VLLVKHSILPFKGLLVFQRTIENIRREIVQISSDSDFMFSSQEGYNSPMSITYIGLTDWRDEHKKFGIKPQDRFSSIYVLGKSGTGKSCLLQNMVISDVERQHGCAVVDPHGDTVISLLHYIPQNRIVDVIYFNPSDIQYPIAFNPLDGATEENAHLVVAGLIATFKKLFSEAWGVRLEYILRYALSTLLTYPGATLLHIQPLLTDPDFRTAVLQHCTDVHIRQFWYGEFDSYSRSQRSEMISPILNKVGLFTALKPLRAIFGQSKSSFQMQEVMDSGKILLCNFSIGMIGEDASRILGCFLINAIQIATFNRASQLEEERHPYFLYIDEVGVYATEVLCDLVSQARKFKLGLFLAHQHLGQLSDTVKAAVFGNCGTMLIFRTGAEDAAYLAKEFYPVLQKDDFIHLALYSMYVKLQIDGATSQPFSAITLPLPPLRQSNVEEIIRYSRETYGNAHKPPEIQRNTQIIEQKAKMQSLFESD
jgi:hypothetical protein